MESLLFRKQTCCSVHDLVTWAGIESGPTGMQRALWSPDFNACWPIPRGGIARSHSSFVFNFFFLRILCTVFLYWLHQFPFPLTVPERESRSVVSDSLRPHGLHSPWNSPGQNTGVGSLSLLQGIFPTLVSLIAGRFFLPAEPPGVPKNPGVGSLSLLQGISPTQEMNRGLLHCRRILYQLSHQGSLWWIRNWLQKQMADSQASVIADAELVEMRGHGHIPQLQLVWQRLWLPGWWYVCSRGCYLERTDNELAKRIQGFPWGSGG